SEGVDVAEGLREALALKLARDRQEGRLAEEGLGIARADLEHLARALRVRRGDDRRVEPQEAPLLEEAVDLPGQRVADPEDRLQGVGPRPQVRDGPEVLEGGALLLQRVGARIAGTDEPDRVGGDLEGLL